MPVAILKIVFWDVIRLLDKSLPAFHRTIVSLSSG